MGQDCYVGFSNTKFQKHVTVTWISEIKSPIPGDRFLMIVAKTCNI